MTSYDEVRARTREELCRLLHDANTGRITPDATDPTRYGDMAEAVMDWLGGDLPPSQQETPVNNSDLNFAQLCDDAIASAERNMRLVRAATFKPARQETPVSTYDDYIAFVDGYRRQHPQQREGQAHFNVFSIVHPELARGMDGFEGHNPFYDDGNLRAFLAYVRWELGRGSR